MDETDVFGGSVPSGTLAPLWLAARGFPAMVMLEDETPVLTCKLAALTAERFVGFGEGGNLTFGKFESESSVFIRLRYRDMEIYWLVDHSDPEIWEAIAKWKRTGRVPIKFNILYSQPEQSKLETVGMPLDTSPFVETGTQGFEGPTSFMWDGMAALTECPYLGAEALSHLSTVPFRLVIINVLVTRRWLTYLNDWKPDTSEACG